MVGVARALDKVLSQPPQPNLPSLVTCHLPRQPPPLCHDSDTADLEARYPYVPFIPARDTNIAIAKAKATLQRSLIPVPNPPRLPSQDPRAGPVTRTGPRHRVSK